jgi:hypothetical protein
MATFNMTRVIRSVTWVMVCIGGLPDEPGRTRSPDGEDVRRGRPCVEIG